MSFKSQIILLAGLASSSAFAGPIFDGHQDDAAFKGAAMQVCQTDLHTPRQQRQQQLNTQDVPASPFPSHDGIGTQPTDQLHRPIARPNNPYQVFPGQQGPPANYYYGTQPEPLDPGLPLPESERFP